MCTLPVREEAKSPLAQFTKKKAEETDWRSRKLHVYTQTNWAPRVTQLARLTECVQSLGEQNTEEAGPQTLTHN